MPPIEQLNDRAAWLKGPGHACNHPPGDGHRPWRLALMGPPGVGKGTQAALLCDRLGACHLSTGDVFRAAKSTHIAQASPAMSVALECMHLGELVSDGTVMAVVKERGGCLTCGGGFLLDGFPRTLQQAEALEKLLLEQHVALDAVINYQLPLDQIIVRLTGRRTCLKCKAVYHLSYAPPRISGVCDQCSRRLIQREDDREEAIRTRMASYHHTATALLDFYDRKNLLLRIAAHGTPAQVFSRTVSALAPKTSPKME